MIIKLVVDKCVSNIVEKKKKEEVVVELTLVLLQTLAVTLCSQLFGEAPG